MCNCVNSICFEWGVNLANYKRLARAIRFVFLSNRKSVCETDKWMKRKEKITETSQFPNQIKWMYQSIDLSVDRWMFMDRWMNGCFDEFDRNLLSKTHQRDSCYKNMSFCAIVCCFVSSFSSFVRGLWCFISLADWMPFHK